MSEQVKSLLQRAREHRRFLPHSFDPVLVDSIIDQAENLIYLSDADERFSECRVVTAMSVDALESFKETERYQTFWESGETWHRYYSAFPQQAREYNELRLFSDKLIDGGYGVLVPGAQYGLPYLDRKQTIQHLRQYGMHGKGNRVALIYWNRGVLDHATFTYGDSQQNLMVHRFSPIRLLTYATLSIYGKCLGSGLGAIDGRLRKLFDDKSMPSLIPALHLYQKPNPYFEIQIHRRLTYADVEEVLYV